MKNRLKQMGSGLVALLTVTILLGCDLSTPTSSSAPPSPALPNEWVSVDDYTVIVHEFNRETLTDSEGNVEHVYYLHVEYDNQSNKAVDYRLNQWSVFDDENYAYDYELADRYYEDVGKPRLRESMLNPGMQVKGWAAFLVPEDATISRAQFLTGYLDGTAVDFALTTTEP